MYMNNHAEWFLGTYRGNLDDLNFELKHKYPYKVGIGYEKKKEKKTQFELMFQLSYSLFIFPLSLQCP